MLIMYWIGRVLVLDLNIQDHAGNTPLHIAVEHDSLEVVDYLLQM